MPHDFIEVGGGDTNTPLNLRKRIAAIQKYVDVKNKRFLDCGCGAGEYVMALNQLGGDTLGIEYDAKKVYAFKRQNPDSSRVFVGDIQKMAFPDNSFDIALLNEVLEHTPDDSQALREIHRVLKPGGVFIVFSPNRLYPFETHGVFLKDSEKRVPHYIPFVPYIPLDMGKKVFRYWARNYWPRELKRSVTRVGFKILHKGYVWQTFENISGHQPILVSTLKPLLRALFAFCEQVPFIRTFGASQLIVAKKIVVKP